MHYIIGLGNPGEEYKTSRHSAGRIVVSDFAKKATDDELAYDKKFDSLAAKGKMKKEEFQILLPETYMNKSGAVLKTVVGKLVKKKKIALNGKKKEILTAENLIVVHDDLDIGLGKFKISFGKSSGGHKGVESIIKTVKTTNFIRIRIGITPCSPSGKLKKADSAKAIDFILGNFRPIELETLKKVTKKVGEALEMILDEGVGGAMSAFN